MTLKTRINALEAKKLLGQRLVVCSTLQEAQHLDTTATIIITGVPNSPKDAVP